MHLGLDLRIDNNAGRGVPRSTLLNNLVGYWKLDEVSGSRADASGNGLTLTDNNTVASVAKGVGAPSALPALVADFVTANSESLTRGVINFSTANGYTIACWSYIPTGASQGTMVHNGPQPNVGDYAEIGTVGAGTGRQFHRMGLSTATIQIEQGGGNTTLDAWHLYVARYNGTAKTGTLLKDNVIGATSTAGASNPTFSAALFCIGSSVITGIPASWFTGRISCVGFWSTELSLAQASLLWNGGAGLVYPF